MAVTIVALAMAASTAVAAPDTVYCLNGKSTTLPTTVSGGGGSRSVTEFVATAVIAVGGVFYVGQFEPGGPTFLYIPDFPGDTPTGMLPGYSTNVISRGACVAAAVPPMSYLGACKQLARGDGTTGAFQQITVPDWNDPKGKYFDAPAANWVEGLGLTCDNPLALGYRAAGYNVSWGGKADPNHDPKGVRGSGLNNIYPYFIK